MADITVRELSHDSVGLSEAVLSALPGASVYHTPQWMDFLIAAFSVKPRTLAAFEAGEIVGLLPLASIRRWRETRLISLPFTHRVPILGAEDVAGRLLQAAKQLADTELRCSLELRGQATAQAGATPSFVNTTVPVSAPPDALRRAIRQQTLGQLKQAEKNADLVVRELGPADSYDSLDDIMAENRRRLGSLTYPRGFFALLKKSLGDLVRIDVASLSGKPIAMMVTSSFAGTAIYHYGASLADTRNVRPNNLLLWNAIRWAHSRGAGVLDLGTSLLAQNGLIRFKESWGGSSAPIYNTVIERGQVVQDASPSQSGPLAHAAGEVLRRLPLPLFKRVTPPLLREFG
jgi:CelD/BcsL family acetyltransferase involved in cellulose biosynthesis